MSKTDKELAVEVTNNFVSSWLSSSKDHTLSIANINDMLKAVHTTLQTLPEEK